MHRPACSTHPSVARAREAGVKIYGAPSTALLAREGGAGGRCAGGWVEAGGSGGERGRENGNRGAGRQGVE
jgi:hypothetical protein